MDDSAYFNNFNPNTEFAKWAAVEVANFDDIPKGMNSYVLNGGVYAVFLHNGSTQEFPRTMQFILEEWLPNSNYVLDDREHFELLSEKYKTRILNLKKRSGYLLKK
ncbi:GyrI-like domain-containing protein [Ekhidna sp. To15]|uniref:GyrI-like domain-containing protein n=1 Tax=Ekhidna sp. To15 TaxID=3395267 RepID=UPI003F51C46D